MQKAVGIQDRVVKRFRGRPATAAMGFGKGKKGGPKASGTCDRAVLDSQTRLVGSSMGIAIQNEAMLRSARARLCVRRSFSVKTPVARTLLHNAPVQPFMPQGGFGFGAKGGCSGKDGRRAELSQIWTLPPLENCRKLSSKFHPTLAITFKKVFIHLGQTMGTQT